MEDISFNDFNSFCLHDKYSVQLTERNKEISLLTRIIKTKHESCQRLTEKAITCSSSAHLYLSVLCLLASWYFFWSMLYISTLSLFFFIDNSSKLDLITFGWLSVTLSFIFYPIISLWNVCEWLPFWPALREMSVNIDLFLLCTLHTQSHRRNIGRITTTIIKHLWERFRDYVFQSLLLSKPFTDRRKSFIMYQIFPQAFC